ncbi:MAG: hypothetical protein LBL92_07725 [Propionibacteriaceae bacterium]|nr:hypothetical protein [Propionibacteriaceae bacterium]
MALLSNQVTAQAAAATPTSPASPAPPATPTPPTPGSTPSYVLPNYANYTTVFEVNSLTWYDTAATCVNRKDDTTTSDNCTLRQAMVQANAIAGTEPVLITLSAALVVPADQPWIMIDAANAEQYMCATNDASCGSSITNDTYSWFNITRPFVTVDLQRKLGINGAGQRDGSAVVLQISASQVTVRGFNGLFGPESAISVLTGSDDVTLDQLGIDQAATNPYNSVVPNFWWLERGVVINGTVNNLTISNSQFGHHYVAEDNANILFPNGATVSGLTIDNVVFNNTLTSATCSSANGTGCSSPSIEAIDAATVTNVDISYAQFTGNSTNRYPVLMPGGADVVLNNWTWTDVTFSNITSYILFNFAPGTPSKSEAPTLLNWTWERVAVVDFQAASSPGWGTTYLDYEYFFCAPYATATGWKVTDFSWTNSRADFVFSFNGTSGTLSATIDNWDWTRVNVTGLLSTTTTFFHAPYTSAKAWHWEDVTLTGSPSSYFFNFTGAATAPAALTGWTWNKVSVSGLTVSTPAFFYAPFASAASWEWADLTLSGTPSSCFFNFDGSAASRSVLSDWIWTRVSVSGLTVSTSTFFFGQYAVADDWSLTDVTMTGTVALHFFNFAGGSGNPSILTNWVWVRVDINLTATDTDAFFRAAYTSAAGWQLTDVTITGSVSRFTFNFEGGTTSTNSPVLDGWTWKRVDVSGLTSSAISFFNGPYASATNWSLTDVTFDGTVSSYFFNFSGSTSYQAVLDGWEWIRVDVSGLTSTTTNFFYATYDKANNWSMTDVTFDGTVGSYFFNFDGYSATIRAQLTNWIWDNVTVKNMTTTTDHFLYADYSNLTDWTIKNSHFTSNALVGTASINSSVFYVPYATLVDWSWTNTEFASLSGTCAIYANNSTQQNGLLDQLTVTGMNLTNAFFCAASSTVNPSTENPSNGLTVQNSTFGITGQGNTVSYGLFRLSGATGKALTFDNNSFTNNTSGTASYGAIGSFYNATLTDVTVADTVNPSLTVTYPSLTVKNNTMSNNTTSGNYSGLWAMQGAKLGQLNVSGDTMSNNTVSGNYSGLWAFYGANLGNLTITNSNLSENNATGTSSAIWNLSALGASSGITMTDNVSTADSFIQGWVNLYNNGSKLNAVTISNNQVTNQQFKSTGGATIYIASNITFNGQVAIVGNTFTAQPSSYFFNFGIYWDGAQSSSTSVVGSKLSVTNNYFDGFSDSSIYLSDGGSVEVRRNTFGPNTTTNVSSPGTGEESFLNNTVAYMVANDDTNREIATWYPSVTTIGASDSVVDTAGCVVYLTLVEPTSGTLPVGSLTIDLCKTADHTAEIYLGSVTTTPTAAADSVIAMLDAEDVSGSRVRVQTTGTNTGGPESSQYSRWVQIGDITCQPAWDITKSAYADDSLTTELAADSVVESGNEVYWLYQVTNQRLTGQGYQIGVTDDQKTTEDGEVCTVELPTPRLSTVVCSTEPGQASDVCTVTTADIAAMTGSVTDSGDDCQWHQTLTLP